GIYHLHLGEGAEAISIPALVVPKGTDPAAQVDEEGTIHLAWLQEPSLQVKELYYVTFPDSEVAPTEGTKLTNLALVTGLSLQGPVLGLDTTTVYIFWSIECRGGGLGGASAELQYVSFPLRQPSPRPLMRINLPVAAGPSYKPHQGPYSYANLARLSPPIRGSDFLCMPAVVKGQRAELPVVFSLKMYAKGKAKAQPVMVVFSEGELKGYQLIAQTYAASLRPNVVPDSASNLYLAWIDTAGFWQYDVYYASTSPEVKAWLDRTSPQDVLLRAIGLSWGVLSGVALIPLTFAWIFPPLIGVVLFEIFGSEDDLGRWPARVVLGVAVILYLVIKFMLSPALLLFAPLSDQVPALIVVVPVVILALGLGAMYGYMRRAGRPSLLVAFTIFALTDTLLSLAVYSPGFFGGG
ncbi:MAG: hypothetical protein U9R11_05060, partial [Chloroflexota bacterium]|nr:hypothetical protein [Chloroflexota bacterium]